MRTLSILYLIEDQKEVPTLSPIASSPGAMITITLNFSNYPCLEQILMVPEVFEPLKFAFNLDTDRQV